MTATTLWLMRHAHTDANELGDTPAMAGWSDIRLSRRGEAQLELLRERFDAQAADLVVYSSDVSRALRTADAVASGRRIVALRSLREISCGIVDGWMIADVKQRFPDLWRVNESEADADFSWPGGESYAAFRTRVIRAISGIVRRHRGGRIIVVTHAGVISQLIGWIEGSSPAQWSKWRPGNCSVTSIEWNDRASLLEFDDRTHLDATTLAEKRQHGG